MTFKAYLLPAVTENDKEALPLFAEGTLYEVLEKLRKIEPEGGIAPDLGVFFVNTDPEHLKVLGLCVPPPTDTQVKEALGIRSIKNLKETAGKVLKNDPDVVDQDGDYPITADFIEGV